MSIRESLQRILKGLTRAAVESALDIKELGVVEDAQQPEVVLKKSDASGYYHLPLAEWLSSYIDSKGGSRLIGLEDDAFSLLTGDCDIQTAIKAIDTYLAGLITEDTIVWTSANISGGDEQSFSISKHGKLVTMNLDWQNLNWNTTGNPPVIIWTPSANFAALAPPYTPENGCSFELWRRSYF